MTLPPLDDVLATAVVVASPMRVRFRGVTTRESVLFRGPSGWGEFCAFREYDDVEASAWLACALEAAYGSWPAAVRPEVLVNATVPAVPAAEVAPVIDRFGGATTAKIKVAEPGQTLGDDLARVRAVRERMGPDAQLRVDANGAWSVPEAAVALEQLGECRLQYAEQPCQTVEELAQLREELARRGVRVPIAADESIRRAADPFRVAQLGAAEVAILKVAPLGGVTTTVATATRLATEYRMRTVVSSALETSIGMAAGLAAAAAVPGLDLACGLGTVALFTDEPGAGALMPVDGQLTPARVAPDPAAVQRLAVREARRDWWIDRLRRCYGVLDG